MVFLSIHGLQTMEYSIFAEFPITPATNFTESYAKNKIQYSPNRAIFLYTKQIQYFMKRTKFNKIAISKKIEICNGRSMILDRGRILDRWRILDRGRILWVE